MNVKECVEVPKNKRLFNILQQKIYEPNKKKKTKTITNTVSIKISQKWKSFSRFLKKGTRYCKNERII